MGVKRNGKATQRGVLIPTLNGGTKQLTWPRVALAIPLERTVPGAVFHSFLRIVQRGHPVMALPYMRTDTARNEFASHLLKSQFTHILMLDLDHAHPADIVERLARWVVEDPTRLIVSGMYFRRGEPYEPVAWIRGSNGIYHSLAEWDAAGGLVQVHALGTGAMLISREVFERLPRPWFAYVYNEDGETSNGEDMYFCKLCETHGIAMWLDTTTVSPHLTDGWIDERAYRNYQREHPRETVEVPL